jgi:hypothetical protein
MDPRLVSRIFLLGLVLMGFVASAIPAAGSTDEQQPVAFTIPLEHPVAVQPEEEKRVQTRVEVSCPLEEGEPMDQGPFRVTVDHRAIVVSPLGHEGAVEVHVDPSREVVFSAMQCAEGHSLSYLLDVVVTGSMDALGWVSHQAQVIAVTDRGHEARLDMEVLMGLTGNIEWGKRWVESEGSSKPLRMFVGVAQDTNTPVLLTGHVVVENLRYKGIYEAPLENVTLDPFRGEVIEYVLDPWDSLGEVGWGDDLRVSLDIKAMRAPEGEPMRESGANLRWGASVQVGESASAEAIPGPALWVAPFFLLLGLALRRSRS